MRLITQIFSDQSHLANSHNKRDKLVVPFCRHCPDKKETNEHFIAQCPAYSQIRQEIFDTTYSNLSDLVKSFAPNTFANFYKKTGRDKDEYICYYVESD